MARAMSTETYEEKRKCQNREAQRRYRQKMRRKRKGGSVDSTDVPWPGIDSMFDDAQLVIGMEQQNCFPAGQDGGYGIASYSSLDGEPSPGTELSSSDTGIGIGISLADGPWNCDLSAGRPVQLSEGPTPSAGQGNTASMQASPATEDRAGSQRAASDRMSSAQAKLVSKACGMVQELRRLYHLGVELDLLRHEDDVSAHLDAVEQLMQRSGERCPR